MSGSIDSTATAQAIEDSLRRRSLLGRFDRFRFRELIETLNQAKRIPRCPDQIVKEVERLLRECAQLDDPHNRRSFAAVIFPLSNRFDKHKWATELANAISSDDEYAPKMLEVAGWSGLRLEPPGLTAVFTAVRFNLKLIDNVVAFALLHGWKQTAKAIAKCRKIEIFEAVFKRFKESTYRSNRNCCVLLSGAMASVKPLSWPSGRQREVFDSLWPSAITDKPLDWELGVLAEACIACGDGQRFAELTSPMRLGTTRSPEALGYLARAAEKLGDRDCLRRLVTIAQSDSENPFAHRHAVWASLLQSAFDLEMFHEFNEIFLFLHSKFDPLRMQNWGTLGKQLRKILPRLPEEIGHQISLHLNYEEVDVDRCLRAFAEAPIPPRDDGTGDWPFVGAGRVLMKWMINGYVSHYSNEGDKELKNRVHVVIDGIVAMDEVRQREAIYQLLARGQGSYAGAIAGQSALGIEKICSRVQCLSHDELRGEFSKPIALSKEILDCIQPPEYPERDINRGGLSAMQHVADLIVQNQRDLFEGMLWERGRWFRELSVLTDALFKADVAGEDWIVAFLWLIETVTSRIADLIAADRYAHDFKNEFDRQWKSLLTESSTDPESAIATRERFISRLRTFLSSRSGIRSGPRERIRADAVFRVENLVWQDLDMGIVRITSPNSLCLWLIQGQRQDALIPLIQELFRNVLKALEPLSREERLYCFEVTLEDEYWAKLSVRNSYNPRSERASSTGFGTAIVESICKRLRSRDGRTRAPYHNDDVEENGFTRAKGLRVFEQVVFLPLAEEKHEETVSNGRV